MYDCQAKFIYFLNSVDDYIYHNIELFKTDI